MMRWWPSAGLLWWLIVGQYLMHSGFCDVVDLPRPPICGKFNATSFYNRETLNIDANEFPWIVRIASREDSRDTTRAPIDLCLGVLITDRYVLMNAHCYKSDVTILVYLGDWTAASGQTSSPSPSSPPVVVLEVEEVVLHREFNASLQRNDIALLRLERPVDVTEHIRPICLNAEPIDINAHVSQHLLIAGWFFNQMERRVAIKSKKFVHVMDLSVCTRMYDDRVRDLVAGNHVLCAITCSEDDSDYRSGSPLMTVKVVNGLSDHYQLVGLIAFGDRWCRNKPSFFVYVDHYIAWIKDNLH